MVEDAGSAQARALLRELSEQVTEVSHKLETLERRGRHATARDQRQRADLRRELYEAHRLIDGLHRRYPETQQFPYRRSQTAARV